MTQDHTARAVETRAAKRAIVFAEQEVIVLRLIEQAARIGNECPTNRRLASACGLTSTSAAALTIDRLKAKGMIEVMGSSNRRVVKIVKSGLRTAGLAAAQDAEQTVIDMIAKAAQRGETCPSNTVFASALGMTPQSVINILKRLEENGRVTIRRASQSRIATIVATGATTAGTIITERKYAGRKITTPKARLAKALAETVHTNDLGIPCAMAGLPLADGARLFAEICADLGSQAQ